MNINSDCDFWRIYADFDQIMLELRLPKARLSTIYEIFFAAAALMI